MKEELTEISYEELIDGEANYEKEIIKKAKEKLANKEMITKNLSLEDVVLYTGHNSEDFARSFKLLSKNKLTFNIFAALFGPLYFMYRKMYLSSLLFLLLGMIIPNIPFLNILYMILMGVCSNYIYYNKAIYEIDIINKKYSDNNIRKELLRQNGGVNIILPLFCALFITLIMTMLIGFIIMISTGTIMYI